MDDPDAPGKKVGTNGSESVLIEADNFTAENITFENSAGAVRHEPSRCGRRATNRSSATADSSDGRTRSGSTASGRISGIATSKAGRFHLRPRDRGVRELPSPRQRRRLRHRRRAPVRKRRLVWSSSSARSRAPRTEAYLGSPWQKGAATAFIECELGENLRPEGWKEWRGNDHHKTARFVEYGNTGPGADTRKRPAWTRQLSEDEAKNYTVENILSGEDGWNPRR